MDRLELRGLLASLDLPLIQSPNIVKYPLQTWSEQTFLGKSLPEHIQEHRNFLDWAGGLKAYGRVAFGGENQFPSWSFAVSLPTGKKITLFGLWADGTIWVQPRGLPSVWGEIYRSQLGMAVNEVDLRKQWFLRKNGIADSNFLGVLKDAVLEVIKGLRQAVATNTLSS